MQFDLLKAIWNKRRRNDVLLFQREYNQSASRLPYWNLSFYPIVCSYFRTTYTMMRICCYVSANSRRGDWNSISNMYRITYNARYIKDGIKCVMFGETKINHTSIWKYGSLHHSVLLCPISALWILIFPQYVQQCAVNIQWYNTGYDLCDNYAMMTAWIYIFFPNISRTKWPKSGTYY
jgi:hypothetical protein